MNKWHGNETPAERNYRIGREAAVEQFGEAQTERLRPKRFRISKFYEMIGLMQKMAISRGVFDAAEFSNISILHHSAMVHVDFVKYGHPTYLVSKDLFNICMELEVSAEDRAHVFERLPYNCFAVCLEKGVMIKAEGRMRELHSIFVCKDPSTVDGLKSSLGSIPDAGTREEIAGYADTFRGRPFCMPCVEDEMSGFIEDLSVDLDSVKADPSMKLEANTTIHLISALIMLWRSRPEFIVDANLPRSERYNFGGERRIIRTWKFPDKLIVRRPREDAAASVPTGRHVRAHWRAGHFRHYRHERFEREPDGSVKVEFILPCMVHADELVEAAGNGSQANG